LTAATQKILYTDLDGTLLDLQTYSFEESFEAVQLLKSHRIPVIFCSSKTRAEQMHYLQELKIQDPFIVENGSAIFIPEGYFDHSVPRGSRKNNFHIIELGASSRHIRTVFEEMRCNLSHALYGYRDLSIDKISEITGLNTEAARNAANREYSETILEGVDQLGKEEFEQFKSALHRHGISCLSGGKFHTMIDSQSDKGKAIQLLSSIYRDNRGDLSSIGVGDSENDEPLLRAVDRPYLVKKPGNYWEDIDVPGLKKINAIGPVGWSKLAKELVS